MSKPKPLHSPTTKGRNPYDGGRPIQTSKGPSTPTSKDGKK